MARAEKTPVPPAEASAPEVAAEFHEVIAETDDPQVTFYAYRHPGGNVVICLGGQEAPNGYRYDVGWTLTPEQARQLADFMQRAVSAPISAGETA